MADAYVKTFELDEAVEVSGSFTPVFDVRGNSNTDLLLSCNMNPELLTGHEQDLLPMMERIALDDEDNQDGLGYFNAIRIYVGANSYPTDGRFHIRFAAVFTPVTQEV